MFFLNLYSDVGYRNWYNIHETDQLFLILSGDPSFLRKKAHHYLLNVQNIQVGRDGTKLTVTLQNMQCGRRKMLENKTFFSIILIQYVEAPYSKYEILC